MVASAARSGWSQKSKSCREFKTGKKGKGSTRRLIRHVVFEWVDDRHSSTGSVKIISVPPPKRWSLVILMSHLKACHDVDSGFHYRSTSRGAIPRHAASSTPSAPLMNSYCMYSGERRWPRLIISPPCRSFHIDCMPMAIIINYLLRFPYPSLHFWCLDSSEVLKLGLLTTHFLCFTDSWSTYSGYCWWERVSHVKIRCFKVEAHKQPETGAQFRRQVKPWSTFPWVTDNVGLSFWQFAMSQLFHFFFP